MLCGQGLAGRGRHLSLFSKEWWMLLEYIRSWFKAFLPWCTRVKGKTQRSDVEVVLLVIKVIVTCTSTQRWGTTYDHNKTDYLLLEDSKNGEVIHVSSWTLPYNYTCNYYWCTCTIKIFNQYSDKLINDYYRYIVCTDNWYQSNITCISTVYVKICFALHTFYTTWNIFLKFHKVL